MIKAVIFDLDGTIIDSESIQSKVYSMVLKEYGKKPIRNSVGMVHTPGLSSRDIWPILVRQYNISEDIQILINKKRAYFLKLITESNLIPRPGFRKLLKLLKQKGIITGIATGSPLKHIDIITKRFHIDNLFDVYASGEEVSHGKPHPELYQKIIQKLAIPPNSIVALEDSEPGVKAAKAAGIKVIAVPTKFTADQDFSKADLIVKSLNNITLKTLENL